MVLLSYGMLPTRGRSSQNFIVTRTRTSGTMTQLWRRKSTTICVFPCLHLEWLLTQLIVIPWMVELLSEYLWKQWLITQLRKHKWRQGKTLTLLNIELDCSLRIPMSWGTGVDHGTETHRLKIIFLEAPLMDVVCQKRYTVYPLVMTNIAIENGDL